MLLTITPFDWITNPTIVGLVGIASLVIGIVSLLIGIWFYRKGKPLKQIVYEVLSDTPVVTIKRQVGKGKIKIEYEDNIGHTKEINDASLLTLRVWNAGNTDIKIWNSNDTDIEDMEAPIEFEFDKRIVVSLTEVKTAPANDVILPKDLDIYLNKPLPSSSHLGLPRCLLKPAQSIELAVLLNGEGMKIEPRGKIINGEIKNFYDVVRERTRSEKILLWLSLVLLVLLACGGIVFLILLTPPQQHTTQSTSSGIFILVYLVVTTVLSNLFLWWLTYRITHPYKCTCGFKTRFSGRFKKHVLQTHRWS